MRDAVLGPQSVSGIGGHAMPVELVRPSHAECWWNLREREAFFRLFVAFGHPSSPVSHWRGVCFLRVLDGAKPRAAASGASRLYAGARNRRASPELDGIGPDELPRPKPVRLGGAVLGFASEAGSASCGQLNAPRVFPFKARGTRSSPPHPPGAGTRPT